jgi:hypothetical protein
VVVAGTVGSVVAGNVGVVVVGKLGRGDVPCLLTVPPPVVVWVGVGDELVPGNAVPSGPEPVAGASGPVPAGRPGRPARPGRAIAGPPPTVVGWAAKDGRPSGCVAGSGGASWLEGVGLPCVLGQASRKGRTSLRSSARQVPISAHARAAPASHARVTRVFP